METLKTDIKSRSQNDKRADLPGIIGLLVSTLFFNS